MKLSVSNAAGTLGLITTVLTITPAFAGIGHVLRHPFHSTANGIRHVGHVVAHPFHSTANGVRHVGHFVRHPIRSTGRGIHYLTH
ncbi:MAG: hypothetical protein LC772_04165 [Chloroflexi bacterium]|nr:hypothetical protein [Chloroflexota bacterium]